MMHLDTFAEQGWQIVAGGYPTALLDALQSELGQYTRQAHQGGVRDLEQHPLILQLVRHPCTQALLQTMLSDQALLVRALYFDKSSENNWQVGWHQDKTVMLAARVEMPGWGPWRPRDHCWHVQAPQTILTRMLTLRLHLDDADTDNGCLQVHSGSHLWGLLSQAETRARLAQLSPLSCPAKRGDLMLMRPLLLHRSSKSHSPRPRRVVHLEFCDAPLPAPLRWAALPESC
ncbi:phytanoyl-CoA dioxygenase family protein [Leeia sp.]|uniref:phytanoyl-CoA dioxygenase family protein n=1 Tax=Leeia sp. TaxID=2884678 RepID=UPI0035B1BBB0